MKKQISIEEFRQVKNFMESQAEQVAEFIRDDLQCTDQDAAQELFWDGIANHRQYSPFEFYASWINKKDN